MNMQLSLQQIEQLGQPRVLVIGDLILDEYIEGEIQRISREAPVPIVEEKMRHYLPGGAANTLANLASLGAKASAIGVVGHDNSGQELLKLLQQRGIATEGVVVATEAPTTTKTRISAQSRQSVMQQVLRLDRLPAQGLSDSTLKSLEQMIASQLADADVVVISDYGNGVIVPALIEAVRQGVLAHGKIWIVDSQEDLRLFAGASLLTPNKPEAEQNLGYRIETEADLQRAGRQLLSETGAKALLITRGDEGMSLFEATGSYAEVPALNRTEVFDVTGAGDTVVATLAVALGSGSSLPEAMGLANLAASIVVRQLGCATTDPAEMRETLQEMQTKDTAPHD
ncbi:MAG: D-glycero-beta-D-manno-heptose-7-phosphate kinase [Candidatus Melainabacteria bacterium HGW-Melainabacteria-1]|nr:MAG: D-glycero-beta-D-manno-heptose-7-phosphate kinase [Candidatus Melainabacteria bacterium HGW-Melainabacteria-1]